MSLSTIQDLMIVLTAGLVAAVLCRRLNLSILIGYLVIGVVVGRGMLGWVVDAQHQVGHFAEVGIFLLLFSIGLEFSLDDLKKLGRHFVIGGGVQMLLVAIPVSWLLMGFGMEWRASVLIASAFAFSSTVLVFRALSEYGQAQKPHGRRAIGVLLFQDAALVPLLLFVPILTGGDESPLLQRVLSMGLISAGFIVAVVGLRYALAAWLIPMFANYRSSELVVLFTLVSLAGVTLGAYSIGLPPAVGAFAAGLIFNGNRWSHQIDALVLPFRETFAAIFFVSLGLIFDPTLLLREPSLVLLILPALILVKAGAATTALWMTGLSPATALGMGIGLAHVGEFAFVLTLLGVESGLLAEVEYQRVIGVSVCSLVLTPTLMQAGLRLVRADKEEQASDDEGVPDEADPNQAVVIGAGPVGRSVASQLETFGSDVCVMDLSPVNLQRFAIEGFRTVTGDATDPAILNLAKVPESSLVVVCLPDDGAALRVVNAVRGMNVVCRLIVRCRYHANVARLRKYGADEVISEENEASLALLRRLASRP